jgi:hypothetical protein
MNKYRIGGFSRFEFAIVVIVASFVALPLIAALARYQGIAERQQMENEVRDMRTFLNLKLLDLMLSNRQADIEPLAGSNPVALLERTPKDYLGELARTPEQGKNGWFFDTARQALVYRPASFSFPYSDGEEREFAWQLQQIKGSEMSIRLVAMATKGQKPALAR